MDMFPNVDNKDGTEGPYEFNITYFDALKDPGIANDPFHIARFLASQAVALALPGVPAVYIHSLLGSRNWTAGVEETGQARTINREKLSADTSLRNWQTRKPFGPGCFELMGI